MQRTYWAFGPIGIRQAVADTTIVSTIEPDESTDPPIGWALKSRVPPGVSDPADHSPGYGLRVLGFSIMMMAILIVFVGNWVIAQPYETYGQASDANTLSRVGLLLAAASFAISLVGIVMGIQARRNARAEGT
jgi:hypothetical protein